MTFNLDIENLAIIDILLHLIKFQVKTQQGVPGQPTNFRVIESRATDVSLKWDPPTHAGENIISYELYWNDTYGRRGRVTIFTVIHCLYNKN